MPSDRHRLIKNFLSLLSLRGLEFLIPLATIPYLIRTIGIEKYGIIGFGYAFTIYAGTIVQYGFNVTATRDIARSRQSQNEVKRIFSEIFTTTLFLSTLVVFTASALIILIPKLRENSYLNILCLVHVILQSLFPIWLFQGMEKMSVITHLNLVSRIIFIIGLFVFIQNPNDYLKVPILSITSSMLVLAGAMYIAAIEFKIYPKLTNLSSIKHTLKTGRHAFVNQLAPNLYNNSSTFILGLYATPSTLGIYTAATKVVDAASSIGYIISNTFLPYLSRDPRNYKKFKSVMFIIGALGSIFLIVFSQLIGDALDPKNGNEISKIINLTSPGVFAIFITLTFGNNFLMLHKKENIAASISLYTSLVFFLISLYIIPSLAELGSTIILTGGRLTMAIICYLYYKKFSKTIS
ncbi:MAG: oligosaccharide flippase family protein [Patescibacteria group bacterium]|nr:oligosaccharide flippase family protein [Patescibacteria group bacterium]